MIDEKEGHGDGVTRKHGDGMSPRPRVSLSPRLHSFSPHPYFDGVDTFTSIFCVPPPPNRRPL
jgi:hypothetical protein